jgi:DNA-binding XRE family transcriptional regulator
MTASELRRRRIRLGLSREQLAHAVGVEEQTLVDWEEGAAAIKVPHALEQILRQREERERGDRPHAA